MYGKSILIVIFIVGFFTISLLASYEGFQGLNTLRTQHLSISDASLLCDQVDSILESSGISYEHMLRLTNDNELDTAFDPEEIKKIEQCLHGKLPNLSSYLIPQKTGFFEASGPHDVKGKAKILVIEKTSYLRLESFEIHYDPKLEASFQIPELHVYLTKGNDNSEKIYLDKLKTKLGNKNYKLPDNIDLSIYNTVLLFDEIYKEPFVKIKLEDPNYVKDRLFSFFDDIKIIDSPKIESRVIFERYGFFEGIDNHDAKGIATIDYEEDEGELKISNFEISRGDDLRLYLTKDSNVKNNGYWTIDSDGFVYLSRGNTDQILRYTPEGEFKDVFVTRNSGGLAFPTGITFGPDGKYLYVSSKNTDQILRYTEDGKFKDVFVTRNDGGLDGPDDLTFGPDGKYLYVSSNDGILRFDSDSGKFLDIFVRHGDGGLAFPTGITFGPDNNFYVGSGNTDQILRYTEDGKFKDVFVTRNDGGLDGPKDLAFSSDKKHLYVASFLTNEILRYDISGNFVDNIISSHNGDMSNPQYSLFGPDGKYLYVSSNDGILRFDSDSGKFLDIFVRHGDGGLAFPTGITFGPDNNFYVGSGNTDQILRYTEDGKFKDVFVTRNDGGLDGPDDLTFGPDGKYLYVSSKNTDQILRYTPEGEFDGVFVTSNLIKKPHGITFGPNGDLYVASGMTDEILQFDATGNFVGVFASGGGLSHPVDVLIDKKGLFYVSSKNTDQILRYTPEGEFDGVFVTSNLIKKPHGITFGPDDSLYVNSNETNEIIKTTITNGKKSIVEKFVNDKSSFLYQPKHLEVYNGQICVSNYITNDIYCYDETSGESKGPLVISFDRSLISRENSVAGPDGELYVPNNLTNEILRYDGVSGLFSGVVINTENDQLQNPSYMTLGPNNHLFVSSGDQVFQFNGDTGEFINVFVSQNSGGLRNPQGLSFDENYLYVSSYDNNRVLRYDATTGNFIDEFIQSRDHNLLGPVGNIFDTNNHLYVASQNSNKILNYDSVTGKFLGEILLKNSPSDILLVNDDLIFISIFETNSVLVYNVNSKQFTSIISSEHGLDGPEGLSIDVNRNLLYVSSSKNNKIIQYDIKQKTVSDISVKSGDGILQKPRGLTFNNADGTLFISNSNNNEILKYDPEDNSLTRFIQDTGDLVRPGGITFDSKSILYLINENDNKIYRYDIETGKLLGVFAEFPKSFTDDSSKIPLRNIVFTKDDKFLFASNPLTDNILVYDVDSRTYHDDFFTTNLALNYPTNLSLTPDGKYLLVVNYGDNTISRLTVSGDYDSLFASPGNDGLTELKELRFGHDGNLYVTGGKSGDIYKYDGETGNFLGEYDSGGIYIGKLEENSLDTKYLLNEIDTRKNNVLMVYDHFLEIPYSQINLQDQIEIITPVDMVWNSFISGFNSIQGPKLGSLDSQKHTGFFVGSNDIVANGQVITESMDRTSLIRIQNFSFDYDEKKYVSVTDSENVFTNGPTLITCLVSDMSDLSCGDSLTSVELGTLHTNAGDNFYRLNDVDLKDYSTIVVYDKTTEKTFAHVPLRDYGILRISGESFVDWLYYDFTVVPLISIIIILFPMFFDYTRGAFKIIFFVFYYISEKIKSRKPFSVPLGIITNNKISILIPAHNEADGIRESIESALATDYPNKEIIVIDDGSKDNTWNIANSFAEKGLIKLIHREPAKSSKAAALNHGMNYATGDYILCMDGDTQLDKNALKNASRHFTDKNNVALSGNVKILAGDNNIHNLITRLQTYEYLIAIELGRRFTSIFNVLLVISGAFGIFRKEVIRDLHTFDKDTLTEDFDLTLQFRKTRGRIRFISDSIAYTYCPPDWSTWIQQRNRWAYGQFQTLSKNKDLLRKFTFKDSISFVDMYLLDIVLSILFPIGLVVLGVISMILFMDDNLHVLVYPLTLIVSLFLLLELTIFLIAASYSRKFGFLKLFYLVPIMTFFYRPYLKMINLRGYLRAFYNKGSSW